TTINNEQEGETTMNFKNIFANFIAVAALAATLTVCAAAQTDLVEGASSDFNLNALAVSKAKTAGTVIGWGNNNYGQAMPPADLGRVVAISTGYIHSLALKSNGTVVAWGANNVGQLNIPALLNNVVAISAGVGHNLALKADG